MGARAVYLVATDFALYWIHRLFHRGFLWKYHAVHHASKDVEWISASRFHPVNLALGTCAVDIAALLVRHLAGSLHCARTFQHHRLGVRPCQSRLDAWGRLKYVLVSPVFHRWHHASAVRDKNFASTFALWDWMFGTFICRGRAARRLWHRRRGDAGRPDAADRLSAAAGDAVER